MTRPLCRHCGQHTKNIAVRPRGLCVRCYDRTPGIRELYAPKQTNGNWDEAGDELTEAQLDALIAERRATMPSR